MRKEHIGGIVTLGIIAVVIYYFWHQPAGAAGIALRNAWASLQSAIGTASGAGGTRQVAAMPDPATMSTVPDLPVSVPLPVQYGGALAPSVGDSTSRQVLIDVLNAPVGTVISSGGNNGDVHAVLRQRMYEIN